MTKEQQQMIDQLKKRPDDVMEQLLDETCELCHWPYIEQDQEQMTQRCLDCPIVRLAQVLKVEAYDAGYMVGMVDAGISIVESVTGGNKDAG